VQKDRTDGENFIEGKKRLSFFFFSLPRIFKTRGLLLRVTPGVRAINNVHSSGDGAPQRWVIRVFGGRKSARPIAGIIVASWPANATLSKGTERAKGAPRATAFPEYYIQRAGTPPCRSRDARLLLTALARNLAGRPVPLGDHALARSGSRDASL